MLIMDLISETFNKLLPKLTMFQTVLAILFLFIDLRTYRILSRGCRRFSLHPRVMEL